MEVSEGTLADILGQNEVIEETPVVETPEPVKEEVQEAKVEEPPVEEVVSFSVPQREKVEQKQEVKEVPSIDEVLKKSDRNELLKKLGLDDSDIQFIDHRKNGGDPYKFIEAKFNDLSKVSDLALIKDQIAKSNSYLSSDEIEILTQMELQKYGLHEDADEGQRRLGQVLLKRDAQKIRDERMQEYSKFQIQTAQKSEPVVDDSAKVYAQAITEHPFTAKMLTDKKVVADAGEEGYKLNFGVDNPQELIEVWTNPEVSQKYLFNEKGEPDLEKQYLMSLLAVNPKFFIKSLIDHGRKLGEKQRLTTQQNLDKKTVNTPGSQKQSESEAWSNAKEGRLGQFI